MIKKSTSQSAFFNLRVLAGLFIVLAGVVLALVSFGAFSAQAQQKSRIIVNSNDPRVPDGFDCSQIRALGIDRQENMRAGAIMIACGESQGGSASTFSELMQQLLPAPLGYGGSDFNLITPGPESGTHITQSETFSWTNPDDPNTIVIEYNDSRGVFSSPINIIGASVSTDGGATFARLTKSNGQSPFSNTLGDPVMLFNKPTATWFAYALDLACGGQGIGGYKSTNPSDPNSWTMAPCVHTASSDDRESGWADNNTSSSFFGRMYVSWNDFAVGGNLKVRFSTDNGTTWTERQLAPASLFIRDVQITGDLVTGDVYVAGMNEGGGGTGGPRSNKIYRSTDGGNTWTNTYTGPNFTGPAMVALAPVIATSPPYSLVTGDTWAGVSLPPSTTSFTTFMLSTALAPIPATSIISGPQTVV